MARGNDPCDDEATPLEANPQLSCTVRAIAHVGGCIARGVAMFSLIVAGAFSALTPEPLWLRAMSFVVFGLVPALAAYLIPPLISLTLRRAGRIYDPIAAVLWPALWGIIKHALSVLLDFTWLALIYFASALETCAKLLGETFVRVLCHEHRRTPGVDNQPKLRHIAQRVTVAVIRHDRGSVGEGTRRALRRVLIPPEDIEEVSTTMP